MMKKERKIKVFFIAPITVLPTPISVSASALASSVCGRWRFISSPSKSALYGVHTHSLNRNVRFGITLACNHENYIWGYCNNRLLTVKAYHYVQQIYYCSYKVCHNAEFVKRWLPIKQDNITIYQVPLYRVSILYHMGNGRERYVENMR